MTKIGFLSDAKGINGFCVEGHSSQSYDDLEGKLVCSAISSACYMVANTITEIVGDSCEIEVEDAFMRFSVKDCSDTARSILKGFKLHISELKKQYKDRITITTEV